MKIKFSNLSIIIFFVLFANINAQKVHFRKLVNHAFGVGEKLIFNVNYSFVTAGIAEMNVQRISRISGRKVYYITFKVNTVPIFDHFYKVRDRYVTYLDVEGLFPWRFEQHIREGHYKRDFAAFFDQRRDIAKTSDGTYKIPKYVNDIVSALYYARTLNYSNLKVGEKIQLKNFYKNKVYPLGIRYLGKETVTVKAGTFRCIMLEPIIVKGGLFKSDGKIIIWLTDDELKMPVKVRTKIIIGSINAELIHYEGLAGKLTSKK